MAAKLLYRDAQGRDSAVDLPPEGAFLGRAIDCIVRTDDAMVSRKNCKVTLLGGRWYVEDLGSANGTFINERRIQKEMINHGDVIRCGSLQVRFVEVAAPEPLMPSAQSRRKVSMPQDATSGMPAIKLDELAGAVPPEERLTREGAAQPPSAPPKPKADDEAVKKAQAEQAEAEAHQAQIDQLTERLADAEKEQKRLGTELRTASDARDQLQQQCGKISEELRAQLDLADQLRGDVKELKTQLGQTHDELSELQGQLVTKDHQLSAANDDVRRTKQTAEALRAKLEELSHSHEQELLMQNSERGEAERLREVIQEREHLIEEQRTGLQKQEAQIQDLQGQRDSLREKVARLETRVSELQSDNDRLNQLLSNIQSVDHTSPDVHLEAENQRLRTQLEEADRRLAETEEKLSETGKNLAETEKKLAETEQKHAEIEKNFAETQQKLHDSQGELAEAQAKLHEAAAPSAATPSSPPEMSSGGEAEQKLRELKALAGSAYDGLNEAISELRMSVIQTEETFDRMERAIADRDAAKKLRGVIDQTKDRVDEAKGQIRSLRSLLD